MPSYFALVPCDCCGVVFDAESDVLVIEVPNTDLRLLVVGDFCSVCSALIRSDVEAVLRDFQPSTKRR